MLWKHYVFKRGDAVLDFWDQFYKGRDVKLLYITGKGFDLRVKKTLSEYKASLADAGCNVVSAELLLIDISGYELNDELIKQTEENEAELRRIFSDIGSVSEISIGASEDEELTVNSALRDGVFKVQQLIQDQTDVILDVSSLPRVLYLSLLTGILHKLIPNKNSIDALFFKGINFQVLVAEDAVLDAKIKSEDPGSDLVRIPGYSSALEVESVQDWPLVWFPIIGEGRSGQLERVMALDIPDSAEICPVIPHPSRNLRRADELLVEYERPLFANRKIPTSNVLYVHESNPFEAYRQLRGAMNRYKESLQILGGCRVVVTPLASKLITLGAGLACFELQTSLADNFGVAIPYAAPKRYSVNISDLEDSSSEIAVLVLTGEAYSIA